MEFSKKSVFYYEDYRDYMLDVLGNNKRTGNRAELAQAIQCQPSQLSQILSEKLDLSTDQATLLSEFLGHNEYETQFFLYLVLHKRASSKQTQLIYKRNLDELKKKGLKIKNQLKKTNEISELDQMKYYSHWKYGALHMLLPILPTLSINSLYERLMLPRSDIDEAVKFLLLKNFIQISDGQYKAGHSHLHLDNESDLIRTHHTNWRLHTLQNISENTMNEGLHYSVLYSLSKEDLKKIKSQLLDLIRNNLEIVRPSPEETVAVFTADLYEL